MKIIENYENKVTKFEKDVIYLFQGKTNRHFDASFRKSDKVLSTFSTQQGSCMLNGVIFRHESDVFYPINNEIEYSVPTELKSIRRKERFNSGGCLIILSREIPSDKWVFVGIFQGVRR